MRLGLNLGYWGAGNNQENLALAREADRLGYSVAWAAEAYGSDAVTVVTWVAAQTERIDVGTAVMQIPARTPAATAMTAATLDTLSGGRFRLGLGVSGPQVSEGWHGIRFADPLGRTREYVDIVRMVLRRERVRYQGKHFTLPLPDGPGKALKLIMPPSRPDLPIYLAAVGPRNVELAGRIADGILSVFFSPEHSDQSMSALASGLRQAGRAPDTFDVVATVPVVFGDDPRAAGDLVRGYAALYLGGMGSREQNFYNALARRMGYPREAEQVQDHYLAGDRAAAMAAVPFEFIDATSLLGPVERVAERMRAYADAGVTTLALAPHGTLEEKIAALGTAVRALELSGAGT